MSSRPVSPSFLRLAIPRRPRVVPVGFAGLLLCLCLAGCDSTETGSPETGNQAPVFSSSLANQSNQEADTVSLALPETEDPEGDPIQYSADGLPDGLSIDPATGVISGTIARGGVYQEETGLLVIEMESQSPTEAWSLDTAFSDYTGNGYLIWEGSDNFNTLGEGPLSYPIEIATPGTYQFEFRGAFGRGSDPTEHNDAWLKIEADVFFGENNDGRIVCPGGFDPQENDCAGGTPNGSSRDGWFKAYRSGGSRGEWAWLTRTSDNDAHQIYATFDDAGTYAIHVNARSSNYAIDRMAMSRGGSDSDSRNPSQPVSSRTDGAASDSPYTVTITASDGDAETEATFTWTVDAR